jgi:hypothetical protein
VADTALVVAISGNVLAAIALGWNILRDVRDRAGKLKVNAFIGAQLGGGPDRLVIKCTNIGRRTIVPAAIGITVGPKGQEKLFIMLPDSGFSKTLQPGEWTGQMSTDFTHLDDPTLRIRVDDSLGGKWYVSDEEIRGINRAVRKAASERKGG